MPAHPKEQNPEGSSLSYRVWGLGSRAYGLGFRVLGSGASFPKGPGTNTEYTWALKLLYTVHTDMQVLSSPAWVH